MILIVIALVGSSPWQALADTDRRLAGIDVDVVLLDLDLDDGLGLDEGLYDGLA